MTLGIVLQALPWVLVVIGAIGWAAVVCSLISTDPGDHAAPREWASVRRPEQPEESQP